MTKIICSVFILLIVNFTYAENKLTFDEKINKAEVIFIGKLTERYEQMESILKKNGESVDKIYTTHIFEIEEVLKGQLEDENISVKLLGGYDKELKKGAKYNKNTYAYYESPYETALLFLNYDELNKFYYSSLDNDTAFLIHGSIEVISHTNWVPIFEAISKKNPEEDTVTLDILRKKIGAKNE